jgi:hypothetical protein
MQDEPDPPRKVYGFKPREFERANRTAPPVPPPAATESPAPDPGIPSSAAGKIDVRELIRTGAGEGSQLGKNAVANRANEIHVILRENLKHDQAAGHYDLGTLDDSKRRIRIRNYWIAIVAFDTPFALFAFWIGHGAAIPFVCSIAAIALFTSYLTWQTFFLRTHY